MLVIETLAAPPSPAAGGAAPSRRRRTKGRRSCRSRGRPPSAPTAPSRARRRPSAGWSSSAESDQAVDDLVTEGLALLNRALFAQGAAAADPHFRELAAPDANAVRIGYGTGEEVAIGRYTRRPLTSTSGPPAPHAADSAPRSCGRRSGSRPCSAAAKGSTPARRCCCAPAPTSTPGAIARRRCSCGSALEALLVELERRRRRSGARGGHGRARGAPRETSARPRTPRSAVSWARRQLELVRSSVEICERVLRRRRVLRGG